MELKFIFKGISVDFSEVVLTALTVTDINYDTKSIVINNGIQERTMSFDQFTSLIKNDQLILGNKIPSIKD